MPRSKPTHTKHVLVQGFTVIQQAEEGVTDEQKKTKHHVGADEIGCGKYGQACDPTG
jgi:hypothetical protein